MAHDSLWIAYAKAHYPQPTYVALINYFTEKRDMNKVRMLRQEAERYFGIKVLPRKFGQDNRRISIKDNVIYQSLASVKNINLTVADKIEGIRNKYFDTFDLYLKLKELGLDKTQIEVLAKISYFNDNIGMLWLANNYQDILQLNKSKLIGMSEQYGLSCEDSVISMMLLKSCTKETAKQLKFEDKTLAMKNIFSMIKRDSISPLKKAYWEIDLIGEVLDDLDYYFFKVEKYNDKKGSILLESILDNMLYWHMYRKDMYIKNGDIIAIPKNQIKDSKGLPVIGQMFNLTQLFKGR